MPHSGQRSGGAEVIAAREAKAGARGASAAEVLSKPERGEREAGEDEEPQGEEDAGGFSGRFGEGESEAGEAEADAGEGGPIGVEVGGSAGGFAVDPSAVEAVGGVVGEGAAEGAAGPEEMEGSLGGDAEDEKALVGVAAEPDCGKRQAQYERYASTEVEGEARRGQKFTAGTHRIFWARAPGEAFGILQRVA